MLLRFRNAIRKHNERAFPNSEPRRPVFQEPAALIDRCAKAPMGYTTAKGVKIVPVGLPSGLIQVIIADGPRGLFSQRWYSC